MKLDKLTKIVIQPAKVSETEELTINRITDYPQKQQVRAIVNELPEELTLWEEDNYDADSTWTLENVEERIADLLIEKGLIQEEKDPIQDEEE